MPPDIQRGMYVEQFTCRFCAAFYHAAQLLHAVGIRQRIRCHETLTCLHIIIFPEALFYTHSRTPLSRKHSLQLCLWPACSTKKVMTVTSVLHPLRPLPAPLRISLWRPCQYTLPSCRTGNSCTHSVLSHDERYFWPYNYRKPETDVSSQLCT